MASGVRFVAHAHAWRLAPVIRWLVQAGRRIDEPCPLLEALASQLLDVGAPLWRLRLSCQTLHPQIAGWLMTWTRTGGAASEQRMPHGIRQSPDYLGSPIQAVRESKQLVRHRLDRLPPSAHPVLADLAAAGGTDYLALPLDFSDGHTNCLIVATDRPGGFDDLDIAQFTELTNYLTPILEVLSIRRIAGILLDTYVGPRAGRRVLDGLIKRGDGETLHAAIWFSDLRDFTALTETLQPAHMLDLLNTYFELVSDAVTPHGGEILRFIGDATLIVFSEDTSRYGDACRDALNAALDAFAALDVLNHQRRCAGEPAIGFGVGLHVGDVIYGNVGARERLDFTVMGSAVNRAARIESLTRELSCPLLFSDAFAQHSGHPVRKLGDFELRGVALPQPVFTVCGKAAVHWPHETPSGAESDPAP